MMSVTGITGADAARTMNVNTSAAAANVDDSFQAMFAKVSAAARDTLRTGEAASIAGVSGDTSVQNVVRAMMTAEQQLRAAIAVRDRVVAAYQEVSRMQI
ncbi:flagellar hook-basal body complex protein FliE [Acuticoccus mangrovi]|uniref:Flagellar hook-basal body complex protein FliE n=1 Tax=Acuticoccus mangrovi TaxID=2796142 RepID=A0A934MP09_9HYPH|nr:flagellar hook-basal body complex protein FliE [Acuticoccus mangrovi]MBJ3778679.1 flagellar hook-basal body complex protein FliE [Acuticoccus mangrovi]